MAPSTTTRPISLSLLSLVAIVVGVVLLLNTTVLADVVAPPAPASARFIKVNNDTKFLVDQYNRTRLFHGVNAVYKIAPYYPSQGAFDPQNSLNMQDIMNLKAWGFTAVRYERRSRAVRSRPRLTRPPSPPPSSSS